MNRIKQLENDISQLKSVLEQKERELQNLKISYEENEVFEDHELQEEHIGNGDRIQHGVKYDINKLQRWAIERYSRQILLPDIGVEGQARLCSARVLVVGAGGLGCPAASYLAGAGVGEIGIVDYDTVDVSNLHRQLLHSEQKEHMSKVDSAVLALTRINSKIKVIPSNTQLNSTNALEILSKYDLVLDCTDNVPTRYLLNDAAVLCKVPLISGSALKMEGQLTWYNYIAEKNPNEKDLEYKGACYRCVFATPPAAETVGSCSASGVCGPLPGVIGTLQALEAIKYICGFTRERLLVGRMLIFDGEDITFRVVKLRGRSPNCAVCSDSPSVTQLIDYEIFCNAKAVEKDLELKILSSENRVTASELAAELNDVPNTNLSERPLLVDVRSSQEFRMCRIDGAVNYPIESLERKEVFDKLLDDIRRCASQVTFICRRGNDSQVIAQKVLNSLGEGESYRIKDLTGGLHAWSRDVDRDFPVY